ncbi:MAG TPA: hypothetical protein PKM73_07915 [Verrucomicrobiota bacterium]|nr:hypothetical protein [Verrucomicrobiota bacterium]HNU51757.1 hypothetical protein [Verrucomicrobiota bacterium]
MSLPSDDAEFVDREFPSPAEGPGSGSPSGPAPRPPTREELEARAATTQQRITELRRAQEELERERTTLEEARRRRTEFEAGRGEMIQHLTRGIALLEQAEFQARRDADQMAKTLAAFREALGRLESIQEETWTTQNWNTELTRALTAIENARMEWNAARLKWTLLDGVAPAAPTAPPGTAAPGALPQLGFWSLCRLGFAFTWPLAAAVLIAAVALLLVLLRR